MSTRAVYTFIEGKEKYHVYKHSDGYPSGAAIAIANALPYAWPLPRYEAMEFAAAFVAGNKSLGGGRVYLTKGPRAHGDLEYRYEVSTSDGELKVKAFELTGAHEVIYVGNLEGFTEFANRKEAAE